MLPVFTEGGVICPTRDVNLLPDLETDSFEYFGYFWDYLYLWNNFKNLHYVIHYITDKCSPLCFLCLLLLVVDLPRSDLGLVSYSAPSWTLDSPSGHWGTISSNAVTFPTSWFADWESLQGPLHLPVGCQHLVDLHNTVSRLTVRRCNGTLGALKDKVPYY